MQKVVAMITESLYFGTTREVCFASFLRFFAIKLEI